MIIKKHHLYQTGVQGWLYFEQGCGQDNNEFGRLVGAYMGPSIVPDARRWLFHFRLVAALWHRASHICIWPRRPGLPSGGPVHPRAHGLWVQVSGPGLESSCPLLCGGPWSINTTTVRFLLVKADSYFLGLPVTALQRDIFTICILIQGNTDKPLRSRLQLSTVAVPRGSDRACAGRGQCDLQRGTWEGTMGRQASLLRDQDNTATPSSLTFWESKPGLSSSAELGEVVFVPRCDFS